MNNLKNFIKQCKHYILGKVKGYRETRDLDAKIIALFWTLVNIIGTGIIITVIVHYYDSQYGRIISYGLLSAIIMYYLKWFRKLVVAKSMNEIDKL